MEDDEKDMLRTLLIFPRRSLANFVSKGSLADLNFPRWPEGTMAALIEKGLVKRIPDGAVDRFTDKPTQKADGYEATEDGRNLVLVMDVMES